MKNIILLTLLFLLHCNITSTQIDCSQDSAMYLTSYNYIINDSVNRGKSIAVSDSIVDLDRFWFSQALEDFPEEQKKVKLYRENRKFAWFDTFHSHCLTALFGKQNKNAENVIFFSNVDDNMLRADLIPCKTYYNRFNYKMYYDRFNYNHMAFQNTGRAYLFIFDKDGYFRKVFSNEMIYD